MSEAGLKYAPTAGLRYGWATTETQREVETWIKNQNGWIGIDSLVADTQTRPPNTVIPVGAPTFLDEEIFFYLDASNVNDLYSYLSQSVIAAQSPVNVVDTTSTTTWYGKTTHTPPLSAQRIRQRRITTRSKLTD